MPVILDRVFSIPQTEKQASSVSVSECPPPGIRSEQGTECQMIVDLPIEDYDVPSACRRHGLMSGRRQVLYGQAAVAERQADGMIQPISFVIGATMNDLVRHLANDLYHLGLFSVYLDKSTDTAHFLYSSTGMAWG